MPSHNVIFLLIKLAYLLFIILGLVLSWATSLFNKFCCSGILRKSCKLLSRGVMIRSPQIGFFCQWRRSFLQHQHTDKLLTYYISQLFFLIPPSAAILYICNFLVYAIHHLSNLSYLWRGLKMGEDNLVDAET